MSKFSGKCDVYDHFCNKSDEYIKNSKIFLGENPVPLRIDNHHDLAPYYSHIIYLGGGDQGGYSCHITEKSYIDTEEQEHLGWILRDLKKYYRKCRRDHVGFNEEEALRDIGFTVDDSSNRELARRVAEQGNKATIDGVHTFMGDYYRNLLLEEMMRLGWKKGLSKYWLWKDWRFLFEKDEVQ